MHEKEFRGLFPLVLALGGFCAMLWMATEFVDYPGGFSLTFREVVCAGLTVGFAALLVVDLVGIWTGDLPHWPKHRL